MPRGRPKKVQLPEANGEKIDFEFRHSGARYYIFKISGLLSDDKAGFEVTDISALVNQSDYSLDLVVRNLGIIKFRNLVKKNAERALKVTRVFFSAPLNYLNL